jgi:thioredoxin:protein disulfide reductase
MTHRGLKVMLRVRMNCAVHIIRKQIAVRSGLTTLRNGKWDALTTMIAKRQTGTIVGLTALLTLMAGLSAHAQDFLKPEIAFRYAAVDTGGIIEIDWAIEDGYYLYKKKLSFASNSAVIVFGDYVLPEGLAHEDEFFGAQQVYRERFYVSIPYTVVGNRPDSFELQVKSQGCADLGICYPPQVWVSDIPLIDVPAVAATGDNKFELGNAFGANAEFLPPDQAFKPYIEALDGNTLEISYQVAPGYYLYKDKFSASSKSDSVQLGRIEWPQGIVHSDEYFGDTEVFYDEVFGRVSLARATPDAIDVDIELGFQGCADGGICYPPITRTLSVSLPAATAVAALPDTVRDDEPQSEHVRLAKLISGASLWLVVATFFGAGLLLALTPCVLPMVPILSGIIAGEGDNVRPLRGFSLALSYVMGMALVYTAAGIVAAAVGVQLQAVFNQPWILILFSGVFVILALGMFGLFEMQMPSSIQSKIASISGNQKTGTMIGAFIMGALSSLIVTACVAPPLVATLTVIGQTGDMLRGGSALFALSLGMGAPLLLVGASAGKLLPKVGAWMNAVKNAFGFMMLALAIWMLSRILPGTVTLALWGVLIFIVGVFMGGLTTLAPESSGHRKLGKGFGLLGIIYGAILLLGSLTGSHSLLRPLTGIGSVGGSGSVVETVHDELVFQRIKTTDDLDRALLAAAAKGQTTMLDFYADWCVSCKEMEAFTFTDAGVHAALSNTVLLQADVTANDEQDKALLNRFGVFGPPTIIFFDSQGIQRKGLEVVGYMKAEAFIEHLGIAFASTVTVQSNGTRQ